MARPKVNPDFATLTCKTCGKEFQVKWSKREIQKYCSRSCKNHDPEILESMKAAQKKSSLEKYGVEHPMQTEGVKKNFRDSMFKKYGKEYAMQVKSIQDKSKKTTMDNYGVENVLSSNSPLRKQIVDTWVQNYGVDNPGKAEKVIKKRKKTKQDNHFAELMIFFNENQIEWLIQPGEYEGYHFSKRYKFRCKKCGNTFDSTVYVPNDVFCELCFPTRRQTGENTLLEFLNLELNGKVVSRHNRIVLDGKELDFYIPDLKIAIEYNGLYWHKESSKISKNYHLNKTIKCSEKNIRLFHIFETEWLYKTNVVKSILRQAMGGAVAKINGRDCEIRTVDKETKSEFLKSCHIQGDDLSSVAYGLFYKGAIVSIMTFCKSRFDKNVEWEISRFCSALNTKVHGGASKLFSIFLQDYKPKSVVSYSDRRLFSGGVYSKLGMEFAGFTPQGYHYISPDHRALFSRQMYQKAKLKDKLEKFDPVLSEWENMKVNGFDRIWDCGHSKWIWVDKTVKSPIVAHHE